MSKAKGQVDPIRSARVVLELNDYLGKKLLQSASDLPKYVRLENALVCAMDSGVIVEGDKLPSEAELTSMSTYSLGTVQKALRSLSDAGHITRKTGVGTIVQANNQSMRRPLHSRYSKPGEAFLPVFPKILDRQMVTESGPWSNSLGESSNIFRLERRIEIGKELVALSDFYVDADKFPFFLDRPIDQLHTENFKLLLQTETGQKVRRLDHKITFSTADPLKAEKLGVEPESQILNIRLTAWDQANEALYFQIFFLPPNELELTIETLV